MIYDVKPAPTRSFPIAFKDGTIVYPDYAYPLRKEIGERDNVEARKRV